MDNLGNDIYAYYVKHFDTLPLDKQLHFASRIYVWSKNDWSVATIESLRPRVLPNNAAEALRDIANGVALPIRHGSENLRALRAPYFARYPKLRTYAAMLYWAVLLERLYDIDGRAAIAANVSTSGLEQLYDEIGADRDAITALSTYAINFLYLYQRFVRQEESSLSPKLFEDITVAGQDYAQLSTRELQLKLYLLAHCIVADSLFYTRELPQLHRTEYRSLLSLLESMVRTRFNDISLDNKLEFLVCCRLVGHTSALEGEIYAEASRSVSSKGIYLIDTENASRDSHYTTLDKSEHRNVLYILSQAPRRH